ncbi:MAG: serine protease [Planctomycetota bacterium]
MKYTLESRVLRLASLAGGSLLLFSGVTFAAKPLDSPESASFEAMQMQVVTEGITHEEYLQRQEELNTWLTGEMPIGTLDEQARIQLSPDDIATIETSSDTPLVIGVVKPVAPKAELIGISGVASPKNIRNLNKGVLTPTENGGWIWALTLASEEAGAIRAHIENLSLPDSVELYFYSPLGEAFGPYVGSGPNGNGEFWTESVFGSEGILQLHVPGSVDLVDLRKITLSVTEVGHIGKRFTDSVIDDVTAGSGFCGNVACIVDASCYNVPAANPAKDAVAKMEWIAGAFIYTCTGGLLNDNNPTQNNYFLTANHCVNKNNTASNVQFYWRFRTSSCNGACPSNTGWPYKTTGSTLRKTGKAGDFTLLQLNSNPPAGSVLLGWTTAPVANSNGVQLYRISNPNFGPQVYSQHDVSTSAPTCTGWPRGQRIYSRDITGATDGGSSGSPVVNGSTQVVGQLSGACGTNPSDPCASAANATVDGAFAYYYSLIQPFINP